MRKHIVATFACTANDGCALVGRAGRHTGTATTTLDDPFGCISTTPLII
ncbi:hypothetical protein [Segatella oulorum]|nr:hypothetical protein [Segatella oulorum]